VTQLVLDLPFRQALERHDFLVAPCNAAAVTWIDSWPAWPDPVLVVYGPSGCGKSHLSAVWRARSGATPLILGERFVGLSVPDVVPAGDGAYLMDDADRVVADRGGAEFLLHLVNRVRDRGGWLLMTGQSPPSRWPAGLPDLASRLAAAHAVAVEPLDDALIHGLIVKLFADRQVSVGPDVVAFMAARAERSFDGIRRVVAAVDRTALATGRPVTVPLVRTTLDSASEQLGLQFD